MCVCVCVYEIFYINSHKICCHCFVKKKKSHFLRKTEKLLKMSSTSCKYSTFF